MKPDNRPDLSRLRSSYCDNHSAACVEHAPGKPLMYVRDSKDCSRPGVAIQHHLIDVPVGPVEPIRRRVGRRGKRLIAAASSTPDRGQEPDYVVAGGPGPRPIT
jgi:hypothetical protein